MKERDLFKIYCITAPNERVYIGMTKNCIKKRLSDHLSRSRKRKTKHPFYDCIRKHEGLGFTVSLLETANSEDKAKELEIAYIKQYDSTNPIKGMNVSSGGDYNVTAGVQKLRELRSDPEWSKELDKKVSQGLQAFYASDKSLPIRQAVSERSKKWVDDNRDRMMPTWMENINKAIQHNKDKNKYNLCLAWQKALEIGVKEKYLELAAGDTDLAETLRRQAGTARAWRSSGPEKKQERCKNISEAQLKKWQQKDEKDKINSLTQLASARDNIDHDKRKRNQKIGLANYWTPERRKEYGEKVKERNKLRKQKQESESL